MISVVIPFVDEEKALPGTLGAVLPQARGCEIIAVDGGSRDASRGVLAQHPQVRIIEAERGRASQLNAGARAARGELLLFLHADAILPDGALAALEERAVLSMPVWGGFRHRFAGDDWRLALVSRLHNLRCRITGVFYGDQAMFVTRELFERAGGFPDGLMEDIGLSEALLRKIPPTFLVQEVISDPRKFVRMGVWRSLGRVIAILIARRLRLPIPMTFFSDVR